MSSSTTVLVPTIGRMEFLPATRRSLESQSRTDYKVLVLDNASPPEARDYLDRWAASDRRVELLRTDERIPMFANFNRGMRAVDTPFVTFFHDDDEYEPRYLEVLVGLLERHPEAAFSGSNFDYVDEYGTVIEERRWIRATEPWSGFRYIEELVGRGRNVVPMPGLVFRRDAFGPEGFDETLPIYFGDFVLLMRAAETRGMVACVDPVVRIRKHPMQASKIEFSRSMVLRTEVMSSYLDELLGRHPEAASFVASLRRRIVLAHRAGLVWGWLAATETTERGACLESLGDRPTDVALRGILGWVDKVGIHPPPVGLRLVRAARTVAAALRI